MVRLSRSAAKKKKALGGYRPGAGRPKGQKQRWNRKTMYFLFDKRKYKTPLEYMVGIYNDKTVNERRRDRAARDAAKYCHAQLQAVTNKDGDDILPDLSKLPDEALRALAALRSLLSATTDAIASGSGTAKAGNAKTA